MHKHSLLTYLKLFGGIGLALVQADPTITLEQATVIGTSTVLPSATVTVNQYLGVPFAVSPPRRFEPPQPLGSSSATIKATKWSPKCIETVEFAGLSDTAAESEDCLYLNVYTPAGAEGSASKAVLFWLYGGSLQFGNAGQPAYDGSSFAANQDVVVVTTNYRTNIFGFSNAPDLPRTSRNAGLLDQRLALQWVQDNIAAFGGDPDKVTIFGESSGASSVDRLLTAPPAGKLPYRAAILQSGQASVSISGDSTGPAKWATIAAAVGCPDASLACMQSVNSSLIKDAVKKNAFQFTPQNDKVTQNPTPLIIDRALRKAAHIPMMIGSNSNEAALFVAAVLRTNSVTNGTAIDELVRAIAPGLQPIVSAAVEPIQNLGLSAVFFTVSKILTDVLYTCPARSVSYASNWAGNPTWRYLFNATFPDTQAAIAYGPIKDVGAFHSSEIPLVFGTYSAYSSFAAPTEQEIALSKYMQGAWASFAKNPTLGPGWTNLKSSLDYVGCLGCSSAPNGVSYFSATFLDLACPLYNLLYTANKPLF